MRENYTSLVYTNEGVLFSMLTEPYPSQFNDFLSLWNTYNLNDTCTTFFSGSNACIHRILKKKFNDVIISNLSRNCKRSLEERNETRSHLRY